MITAGELREKIAKHIFHEHHPVRDPFGDCWGITGTVDDESWRRLERHCFHSADQILALIKDAGYVKLAGNQSLPHIPYTGLARQKYHEAQQDMLKEGFRRVKVD